MEECAPLPVVEHQPLHEARVGVELVAHDHDLHHVQVDRLLGLRHAQHGVHPRARPGELEALVLVDSRLGCHLI